jgi:hypothetical protein
MKNPIPLLRNWIRNLLLSEKQLHRICIVIEKLERALNSGLAVYAVELTKSDWDNKLRDRMISALKQALILARLAKVGIEKSVLVQAQISLEGKTKSERNQFYEQIGGLMLGAETGMDTEIAAEKVKDHYQNNKEMIKLEAGI